MRTAQLARRVARLERAFGRRAEEDQDQVFAQLDQLSPAQRRERIQFLATKIVKDRGIELLPGEQIVDAAVQALLAVKLIFRLSERRRLLQGNHDTRRRLHAAYGCMKRNITRAKAQSNRKVELVDAGAGQACKRWRYAHVVDSKCHRIGGLRRSRKIGRASCRE